MGERGSWFRLGLWALLASGCARAEADPGEGREPVFVEPPETAVAIVSASSLPAISVGLGPAVAVAVGPCPPEMALIERRDHPLCVDRFEASLREVGAEGALASTLHPYFERPASARRYAAVSVGAVFPQAYISRDEASAACANVGKRLCTRAEWQRACRGGGVRVYPYGDHRVDGACNSGKPPLLPRMFPERGYHYAYDAHFNAPELAREPGFLARTGELAACTSELGVHDMVGNLHEWVSDGVGQAFLESFEAEGKRQWQPARVGNGMFLGGFFSTQSEHGAGCNFTTIAHEPAYHDYSTGFRCCRDAAR